MHGFSDRLFGLYLILIYHFGLDLDFSFWLWLSHQIINLVLA